MSETASSRLRGRHQAARPGTRHSHPYDLALTAVGAMPALSVPLGTDFHPGRINIGSAVAGDVGTSERSYDVWGDAMKMPWHGQNGAPGSS